MLHLGLRWGGSGRPPQVQEMLRAVQVASMQGSVGADRSLSLGRRANASNDTSCPFARTSGGPTFRRAHLRRERRGGRLDRSATCRRWDQARETGADRLKRCVFSLGRRFRSHTQTRSREHVKKPAESGFTVLADDSRQFTAVPDCVSGVP